MAIRTRMERNLARLKTQIVDLEEATKPISPENAIGRISRMDAINNKSVNEAALRTAVVKLSATEKAYQNIDQPDFGLCTRCKQPINPKRLLFMPESTRCMKCTNKL